MENEKKDNEIEILEIKDKKQKRKSTSKDNLNGKFLLVRVGTNDRPATSEDISEIKNKLEELLEEKNIECTLFVTHHAISIDIIGSN
jgi:hypothetical protein